MPSLTNILEYLVLCCSKTKLHSECCIKEQVSDNEKVYKRGCLLDCGGRSRIASRNNSSTQIDFLEESHTTPHVNHRKSL